MEIIEVTSKEYTQIIPNPYHAFNSAVFNELNSNKCDETRFFVFKNNKPRLGIIGGVKGGCLCSPFSAPFGGFTSLNEDVRLQYLDEALYLLNAWAKEKGLETISIILPPPIYNESFVAKQTNCLFRKGYATTNVDLNYSFNLDKYDDNYVQNIWRNARKNLNISNDATLKFKKCGTLEENKKAYEIIRKNRETRGYPLRMTWNQVAETAKILDGDYFIVSDKVNNEIGAAIVFKVNEDIVQVIYWGDLPEFSNYKTMNFLSSKVFEYYRGQGKKIVDIGPSTDNSIPNHGLCEFKESIGCTISVKNTFKISL